MRSSRIVAAAAACLALPIVGSAQSNGKSAAIDWRAFDKYVEQAAHDWHVPALAIAVVKDDSVVFAKGYGVIEIGKPARADEHTRFAIGSTTKAMTSVALGMLVDEGKLHWDDRVIDHLPEFRMYDPYVTRELTVRDLLTHRTGLGGTDLFWVGPWKYSLADMIQRLRYVKPVSSFRSEWEYQNVMYAIGGTLIERISGMPWETFVRTRIFTPLGMNETEPLVSLIKGKPNVAVPHAERNDSVRVVPIRSTDAIAPAGSVWSSVSDMSKWMRFILDSGRVGSQRLLKPETFRELIAPQIRAPMEEYPALRLAKPDFFSYGLGWFIQDYRGQAVWMHTGSIDGMCALIGLMPDKRMGVYVLENLDHAEIRHGLMYSAFDLYDGGASRDWSKDLHDLFASLRPVRPQMAGGARPESHHPSLPLEKYVGTYVDSTYGAIQITMSNGALQVQAGELTGQVLDPVEYEMFRAQPSAGGGTPLSLTFVPDGAGNVMAVRLFGVTFPKVRAAGRR
jgi:CubicO group peptidase (beta-lactamase class C family)